MMKDCHYSDAIIDILGIFQKDVVMFTGNESKCYDYILMFTSKQMMCNKKRLQIPKGTKNEEL